MSQQWCGSKGSTIEIHAPNESVTPAYHLASVLFREHKECKMRGQRRGIDSSVLSNHRRRISEARASAAGPSCAAKRKLNMDVAADEGAWGCCVLRSACCPTEAIASWRTFLT